MSAKRGFGECQRIGSFGPYQEPTGEGHAKPKRPRRWIKRSLVTVVVLGVLGGGVYGAWQWTQSQFYVGANGDHVAVYQGISQNLLGLRLSSVHTDYPSIELKYLPTYQRNQVQDSITEGSLTQATDKAGDLQKQAAVCKMVADARNHPVTSAPSASPSPHPSGSASGTGNHTTAKSTPRPSTSPSPAPGPTLSPDEQKLAQQCSS